MSIAEREPVLSEMLAFIHARLREETPHPCVIIHGPIGAGKTSTAARLAAALKEQGIAVGGLLSPRIVERIVEQDETIGYTARDIMTGEERPFAGLTLPGIAIGRFYIRQTGIAFARRAIERAAASTQIVFVDEVGRLECDGKGHAPAVRRLLRSQALPVLLVRSVFVERVVETFGIARYALFPVDTSLPTLSLEGGMLR